MDIKKYIINFDNKIQFSGSRITSLIGLGETSTSFETRENANNNGSVIIGRTVNERQISMRIKVDRDSSDLIKRYFAPQKNHVMYVGDRKINCVCESSLLEYSDRRYNNPYLTLGLLCPDPFFYDVSDFGKNIAGIQPTFGFPWRYTIATGVTFGYKIFSDTTIFPNNGDSPVGLKAKIIATRGTAENIMFENLRTGQFVKVNTTMAKGDILEISTIKGKTPSQIFLKKNGTDIFPEVDKLSDFFDLETGDNLLKYSAENGGTNLDVYLYYTPMYTNGEVIEV